MGKLNRLDKEYKYTKNTFKKQIKKMNYKEKQDEYNDVSLAIQKGKMIVSKGNNPYKKGGAGINVKILKWKRGLLIQELQKETGVLQ